VLSSWLPGNHRDIVDVARAIYGVAGQTFFLGMKRIDSKSGLEKMSRRHENENHKDHDLLV